jgi:hypothetical protein
MREAFADERVVHQDLVDPHERESSVGLLHG